MIRHKASYFLSLGAVLVLFFIFPKPVLLVFLLLEILLPVVSGLLLRLDASAMVLSASAPAAALVDSAVQLEITCSSKRPLLAAAAVEIDTQVENLLFHVQEYRSVRIGLSVRKKSRTVFTLETCGEMFLQSLEIRCMDVFGFCSVRVPCTMHCRIKVMPKRNDITLVTDQSSRAKPEAGGFRIHQKGSDTSEVFDLRDYREGDELKAIHWKLTSKMDRLIVREYSDSTRFDTIVLYDIGMHAGGTEIGHKLLSTAIGAVESLSKALVRAGIPHTAAFVFQDRMITEPIRSEADAAEFLYQLISYPLAENNGIACQYFAAGQLVRAYESMVYFTVQRFPEELALIPADVNMDAVVLTDKNGSPSVTQPARAKTLIEVPVSYLRENASFHITL